MPIINCQPRFAKLIVEELKIQTIRKERKIPIKVGDKLFLYTGLRTKNAKKFAEAECVEIINVIIRDKDVLFLTRYKHWREFLPVMLNEFAKSDGFKDFDEMKTWFSKTHKLPFSGTIIKFKLTKIINKEI